MTRENSMNHFALCTSDIHELAKVTNAGNHRARTNHHRYCHLVIIVADSVYNLPDIYSFSVRPRAVERLVEACHGMAWCHLHIHWPQILTFHALRNETDNKVEPPDVSPAVLDNLLIVILILIVIVMVLVKVIAIAPEAPAYSNQARGDA